MSEAQIQRCRTCASAWFPDRLRCPRCGGGTWTYEPAGPGVLEEVTELRRPPQPPPPTRIGSIRLDSGPLVVARIEDGLEPGERIRTHLDAQRTLWAQGA